MKNASGEFRHGFLFFYNLVHGLIGHVTAADALQTLKVMRSKVKVMA